ncbi:MAG TPA: twin-arginine translocase subunit TatC [Pirellulales bacterium]
MAATYSDDLFKDSTMTLPEHLEELRAALLKAIYWLIGGSIIGLYFANWVVDFIKKPLEIELRNFYLTQAADHVQTELKALAEQGEAVPNASLVMESIRKDGLFPELVYIDPQELAQAAGADFTLPVNQQNLLTERDFVNFNGLCAQIVAAGKVEAPSPGKRLWTMLPEPVQRIAEKAADAKEISATERGQIVAALEAAIRKPDFYREEDFKNVALSPSLVELIKSREDLAPYEAQRVNRWLLTDSFPGFIAAADRSAGKIRFYEWKNIANDPRTRLRSLNVQELFFIWMKAGVLFGIVLGSPGIFYHVWNFVAAGLYPHEKKQVHVFLPFSIVLFLAGAGLAYFFVFQYVLDFLLAFNKSMNIDPDIRISEWINFALLLPVMFGVSFQLPLVMFFLERVGIMSIETYQKNWRISVMVIFVLAMILTPTGDPVTLLLMAVPLCGLYFLGIYLCQKWPRQRNPFAVPVEAFDG